MVSGRRAARRRPGHARSARTLANRSHWFLVAIGCMGQRRSARTGRRGGVLGAAAVVVGGESSQPPEQAGQPNRCGCSRRGDCDCHRPTTAHDTQMNHYEPLKGIRLPYTRLTRIGRISRPGRGQRSSRCASSVSVDERSERRFCTCDAGSGRARLGAHNIRSWASPMRRLAQLGVSGPGG